ncbi:hypothetical protein HUT16_27350 [Kitasatospora sp. NA04385]|uniref:hypothetical protein n=1 Tax=Kitasatospora sp. NA04385 TaxID=2742135 RepID=UPI0015906320|nr:hypothetical protein [Kitasatospora sp. NA04385]QKW22297.1 hypothetical protein HUT16_27350 [Kitasatospora sp. NA04385]
MPEQYRIIAVSRTTEGGMECWEVRQERPDGQHHLTVFPTSSLEWRAAEYDIDHRTPDGINLILDMLLHEPHLPDSPPHQAGAAAKGLTASGPAPITLRTAPDRATARAAHLERIAHTKQTRITVTSPSTPTGKTGIVTARTATDPLDVIRANHNITPEGVAEKTEFVEQVRRQFAQQQPSGPYRPAADRLPQTLAEPVWDAALPERDQARDGDSDQEPA